ncbi:MAG: hypothetical protein HY744_24090 [Deltaproteobacteria bacterium]|nr:hypothetical protein [Deltaproteobacteria bacterium]
MKIEADAEVPFARALVYATYRDRLPDLVPFLPNVRRIDVRERHEEPGLVRLVNVWDGAGEIPAVARAFLSEKMLCWTDRAEWSEAQWSCAWRIETHAFTEAIRCQGTNRFIELDAARCGVEIRGELEVDLRQVPGVPRLLAGSLGPVVAQFLVRHITPNLVQVSRGVARYLEQQAQGAGRQACGLPPLAGKSRNG